MKTRKLIIRKRGADNIPHLIGYEDTIIQTPSNPATMKDLITRIRQDYGTGEYVVMMSQNGQMGLRKIWHGHIGPEHHETISHEPNRFDIYWREDTGR